MGGDGCSVISFAAAAAGVMALGTWGISKWLGSYVGNTTWKWKKPKGGFFKLNIDGSSRKQPYETTGPASAGGLIRDHEGFWVVGFTAKLHDCDSLSAELQAIKYGLKVARDEGYKYKNLEVETDCDEAVSLIYDPNLDLERDDYGSVVRDCRELLEELDADEIEIVHRLQNKCADALAQVPIPQGKFHVWYEVSDLPKTHRKNFNDLYLAERASY